MIVIRPSKERGFEDKGWLKTYHTFSFDTYFDQKHMAFHTLRVLNEDTVSGGKGFDMHPHKDMEIVTYVIQGALQHQDSLGVTSVISQGEVQRLTAGSGIMHSEKNLSKTEPVHFLQIWITPSVSGLPPGYQQTAFQSAAKWGQFCLMVSSNGRDGSIPIHQDADIYSTILEKGDEVTFDALIERHIWIQIIKGSFIIQNATLQKGDGAAITKETLIEIECLEEGELLLFDLG